MKQPPTKKNVATKPPKRELKLPNDEPLHIDLSFEDLIKKAVNTPIKKNKIYKK
jgi:hypothetical protein